MSIRDQIIRRVKVAVEDAVERYLEEINIDDYIDKDEIYTVAAQKLDIEYDVKECADEAITEAIAAIVDGIIDEEIDYNLRDWVEEAVETLLDFE